MQAEIVYISRFCRAVVGHWGLLVTSGTIIGMNGIWQSTVHHVPGYVYWAIAVIGLFIAFYRAWREEHIAKEQATETLRPAALIRFAYESADNTACLYVKNTGVVADFFAQ